ncbi:hypothetical protein AAMO2058_001093900 [Amorphochlora amoebiformis]
MKSTVTSLELLLALPFAWKYPEGHRPHSGGVTWKMCRQTYAVKMWRSINLLEAFMDEIKMENRLKSALCIDGPAATAASTRALQEHKEGKSQRECKRRRRTHRVAIPPSSSPPSPSLPSPSSSASQPESSAIQDEVESESGADADDSESVHVEDTDSGSSSDDGKDQAHDETGGETDYGVEDRIINRRGRAPRVSKMGAVLGMRAACLQGEKMDRLVMRRARRRQK